MQRLQYKGIVYYEFFPSGNTFFEDIRVQWPWWHLPCPRIQSVDSAQLMIQWSLPFLLAVVEAQIFVRSKSLRTTTSASFHHQSLV
jgi:hypothetical protein